MSMIKIYFRSTFHCFALIMAKHSAGKQLSDCESGKDKFGMKRIVMLYHNTSTQTIKQIV